MKLRTSWSRRLVAGALGAGIVLGGTSVAGAAKPLEASQNQPEYWEAQGYGDCEKVVDSDVASFTVPAPPDGYVWTAVILKAGATASLGGANPNDVIEDPVTGDVLTHSSGKTISHVIVCKDDGYPYPS